MENKEKPKKKSRLSRFAAGGAFVLILVVGLGVLFYPDISDWLNQMNASRAMQDYQQSVANLTEEDYSAMLAAAREYNDKLFRNGSAVSDAFDTEQQGEDSDDVYWELLKVGDGGSMAYVEIEKIGVSLPIYHGVSEVVLAVGVGHIHGSSLPVGGENTHAVLSAHTGLPSAKLFTNLDQLEIGDTFVITVLGETLTYEVDQIQVVLPYEVDSLAIAEGEDYVTLVTCTPYGVNSHRLLVRGTRVEDTETVQ